MDTLDYIDLKAQFFQALSNPNRLRILKALEHGPKNVQAIAEAAGMSESKTSNLLKQLSFAGLLVCHQHGRKRYYSLFNPCLIEWINGSRGFVAPMLTRKMGISLAA
jgi:DNA-binding transcriptional ArsR family regulator